MKKHYVAPLVAAIGTSVEAGFCSSKANGNFEFSGNFDGPYEVED